MLSRKAIGKLVEFSGYALIVLPIVLVLLELLGKNLLEVFVALFSIIGFALVFYGKYMQDRQ